MEKAENGRMYNSPSFKTIAITSLLIIGVPIFLALFLTAIRVKKMNAATKSSFASNYIGSNSLSLTESKDIFLYSTTTKTRR